MREIEYQGWATADGTKPEAPFQTERYNMSTNTQKINQFKIQIEGERVNFWYHTGTKDTSTAGAGDSNNGLGSLGTWKLLCSTKQASGTQWATLNDNSDVSNHKSYRQHVPKPISTATYNMYPLMQLNATADNGHYKYYFDCSKYDGRNTTYDINISTT